MVDPSAPLRATEPFEQDEISRMVEEVGGLQVASNVFQLTREDLARYVALSTPPTPEAEPAQQDTDEPDPWALRFKRALLAIKYNAVSLADAQVIALRALNGFDDSPPAEKQAAPSGEGEA